MVAGLAAGATTLAGCGVEQPAAEASRHARDHQPGVVTPPAKFAALASFDVITADLAGLVDGLAGKVAAIHAGGAATVTVGVGSTVFDDRFGLRSVRPRFLTDMPAFPNDVLDASHCGGDLLLQICADDAVQLKPLLDSLAVPALLRPRWRVDGFRAENRTTAAGLPTTRNLFGFREGAGNPDPADESLMDQHVWTGDDEPRWARGGSYQVVRLIRLATQLWNRDPVRHQEAIFGRRQAEGSPLAGGGEDSPFDYAGDPDGQLTPLDAHVRRADPRTPESRRHRILRRSYSYQRGDEDGLIFVCFQRDPETGFAGVQRRLTGEALDRYVLPFGGGYYFVPPSITSLRSAVMA